MARNLCSLNNAFYGALVSEVIAHCNLQHLSVYCFDLGFADVTVTPCTYSIILEIHANGTQFSFCKWFIANKTILKVFGTSKDVTIL